jgi:hypothetical protein
MHLLHLLMTVYVSVIYGSFINFFGYIWSNDWVICEWWIGIAEKWNNPGAFKTRSQYFAGETEKNHEGDRSLGHPEHEAAVLPFDHSSSPYMTWSLHKHVVVVVVVALQVGGWWTQGWPYSVNKLFLRNPKKCGRIFKGKLGLKKDCFPSDYYY